MRCPECGQENPEAARFCNSCAAPLGPEAPERRKLATLLFCDMSGSTAMGERVDAESVRDLMFSYFHEMRGAIERHGGTVEKFIGDAVMAVFGVPVAHEDDALRAVRAAWRCRSASTSLNAELEQRFGSEIALRIGVNTGEVVAGDASLRQALVTGDAVNVAARLEQAASPGEILIGRRPSGSCRDAVEAEPVAPLVLKGKSEPLPAYRLLESRRRRRRGHAAWTPRSSAVTHELTLLEAKLADALRGGRRSPRSSASRASASRASLPSSSHARRPTSRSSRGPLPPLRRGHHLLGDRRDRAPGGRHPRRALARAGARAHRAARAARGGRRRRAGGRISRRRSRNGRDRRCDQGARRGRWLERAPGTSLRRRHPLGGIGSARPALEPSRGAAEARRSRSCASRDRSSASSSPTGRRPSASNRSKKARPSLWSSTCSGRQRCRPAWPSGSRRLPPATRSSSRSSSAC